MSKEEHSIPFVPEEDLNLHENFKPIIAENGIIRPKPAPDADEGTVPFSGTFTRMDTIQDLVELRTAEEDAQSPTTSKDTPTATAASQPQTDPTPKASAAKKPLSDKPAPVQTIATRKEPLPDVQPIAQTTETAADPAGGEGGSRALSTVSRMTIFHLKKKRSKKKKDAPLRAAVSPQNPQNPQKPAQRPSTPAPKKPRRWPWVLVILCFLFLGGISGLVPVEKIPLLRNLAYAMGFDKADTARMSFLRALLTWTDKHFALPGLLQQDEESRAELWARLRGGNEGEQAGDELAGLQGRLSSAGGKTSLIDIQALQALQRQKGRAVDEVRGSVMPIPGQEGEAAAPLRDGDVNVRTEANQDKSDVFFGSDTSAVNRQTQDGYDSINTLKKLANPYITDGHPIDWLTNTAKRMMKSDVGLGGINRGLSGSQVNWATDLNDVGDNKSKRDLYHAWITSRMSKYTSNVMLKKALADSSFLGAEMPSMASNVWGVGGVQVDIDSLREDQEAWQEYLEFEKKCKEALSASSSQIDDALTKWKELVDAGAEDLGYPSNCYEARRMTELPSKYTQKTSTVQKVCTNLKQGYESLQEACKMQVHVGNVACESLAGTYTDSFYSFKQGCEVEYASHKQVWEQNWLASHPDETLPENAYDNATDGWKKDGPEIQEVSVENQPYSSAAIFSQIQNDSKGFATWIRAHCEPDEDGGMNCEPEYQEDIDAVRGTIEDGLLKV